MRLRKTHGLAVAVLTVIVSAGSTVAFAQGNQPRTKEVAGTFTGSPQNVKQRTCVGQDGAYLEIRGLFSGTITSNDTRLTGNLEFMAEPALVNLDTGLGTFRGRFRVFDAITRMQKAQGEFLTVVTEGNLNHGFAHGTVTNAAGGPADDFFARFESTLGLGLVVTGHFGTTGSPRTPAVVQGGHCSGPFVQVP
jgi:hypothetical protein